MKNFKSISFVCLAVFLIFSSMGCQLTSTGQLFLSISVKSDRTLVPSLDMTVESFEINGFGPDGARFTRSVSVNESGFTSLDLSPGLWNILVSALNADNTVIGDGNGSVDLNIGEAQALDIEVTPLQGDGSFYVLLTWPGNLIASPGIEAHLTDPLTNEEQSLNFSVTQGSANIDTLDLNAGYYLMTLQLLDGTEVKWGTVQAVRILKGEQTSGVFALSASQINAQETTFSIRTNLSNPVEVTITGAEASYVEGNGIALDAVTTEAVDSYEWFLNGSDTPFYSSLANSTVVFGEKLAVGNYELSLVVKKGEVVSSSGFTFSIIPNPQRGIIIDHTTTDISLIPDQWLEVIKSTYQGDRGMLLWVTGESHSYQLKGGRPSEGILGGMELLELEDSRFAVEVVNDTADFTESNVLRLVRAGYSGNSWNEWNMGEENYWTYAGARERTAAAAVSSETEGNPIDVAMWCWCWDIFWDVLVLEDGAKLSPFTAAELQIYLNALMEFNNNPQVDTRWIFQTAPPDVGGEGGFRTFQMNTIIRNWVSKNGGILFDWADIDVWNSTNTEKSTVTWDGNTFEHQHPEWEAEELGHAAAALGIKKAKAVWWMLARIAGWPGPQ